MVNGYPTQLTVVQGNYGYALNFTLQDGAGNVVDLTSNTGVTFRAQSACDSAVSFSAAMTVISAVNGTVKYVVGTSDFPIVDTYNCQIEVSFSGEVLTWPLITVNAIAKIPV
jgi:hypothetical protein